MRAFELKQAMEKMTIVRHDGKDAHRVGANYQRTSVDG
jgi:hypothetical protein